MSRTSYDLVATFRCAVELAQAVACYPPAGGGATAGPPGARAEGERDIDWTGHQARDAIDAAAKRLKRELGARGPRAAGDVPPAHGPLTWEGFRSEFKDAAHPRAARQALWKLANAAADLSGYADLRTEDPALRGRGLRLLRQGLAQLWGGLTAPQREQLRPLLAPAHVAVGWPPDRGADPPPYDGPARLADEDRDRVLDLAGGFVTRPAGFLAEQRRAPGEALRQAQSGGPESRPPGGGPGAASLVPLDAGRLRRGAEALEELFEDEELPEGRRGSGRPSWSSACATGASPAPWRWPSSRTWSAGGSSGPSSPSST